MAVSATIGVCDQTPMKPLIAAAARFGVRNWPSLIATAGAPIMVGFAGPVCKRRDDTRHDHCRINPPSEKDHPFQLN